MVIRKQINDQHRIDGSDDIVQKARHRSLETIISGENIFNLLPKRSVLG